MEPETTAEEVLRRYESEDIPGFFGIRLDNVNVGGADGDRPLHVACWRQNFRDVRALIEGGAQVDIHGDMGATPLHVAAMKGDMQIAKWLIAAGACLTALDEFGATPHDAAIRADHLTLATLLKPPG